MTETARSSVVSIGVIGCGTIASAVITGLAKAQQQKQQQQQEQQQAAATSSNVRSEMPTISRISLSRRSEAKSSVLKTTFPHLVTVYDDNQTIVDKSDIVFLCVLNDQTATVLGPLNFDNKRHTLISMVSTSKLEMLRETSKLSSDRVFKMICLPSVANQEGCALLVPKTTKEDHESNSNVDTLLSILQTLGGYVECETEEQMNVMITPTCLMGPMYGIMRQNQQWLVKKGIPAKDATYFVGRQYWSMMQDADRGCHNDATWFDKLVEEQTPGGLNEQALSNMTQLGVMDSYAHVMEAVLSRLHGDSDGSLPAQNPSTQQQQQQQKAQDRS